MPKGKRVRSHHKSKSGTGSTKRVACIKKKLKWVKPQIYRVPLSQEQAVLSCCSRASRGIAGGPAGTQCMFNCGNSSGAVAS